MNNEIKNELDTALKAIINKKCWGIIGGTGTGSIISLLIGEKILRNKKLSNSMLTLDQQIYDSEYSFMISSPWRLDDGKNVLSASYFDNKNNGPMIMGLKNIENLSITKITTNPPAYDVKIEFGGKFNLELFACDIGADGDFFDFFTPNLVYGIGPGGEINIEEK